MTALRSAKKIMAHRGRKRISGRREPNGRWSGPIWCCPKKKRGRTAPRAVLEDNNAVRDARLSTPLGLIRARKLITEAEYQAGCEFDRRWVAAVLPLNPLSCLSGPVAGSDRLGIS